MHLSNLSKKKDWPSRALPVLAINVESGLLVVPEGKFESNSSCLWPFHEKRKQTNKQKKKVFFFRCPMSISAYIFCIFGNFLISARISWGNFRCQNSDVQDLFKLLNSWAIESMLTGNMTNWHWWWQRGSTAEWLKHHLYPSNKH